MHYVLSITCYHYVLLRAMNVIIKDNYSQTEGIQPELVQSTQMIVDELVFFRTKQTQCNSTTIGFTCSNMYKLLQCRRNSRKQTSSV